MSLLIYMSTPISLQGNTEVDTNKTSDTYAPKLHYTPKNGSSNLQSQSIFTTVAAY